MRTWADDFNTYDEACAYYGCDTPAQAAVEARAEMEDDWIAHQDRMEALGGPVPYVGPSDDWIPF